MACMVCGILFKKARKTQYRIVVKYLKLISTGIMESLFKLDFTSYKKDMYILVEGNQKADCFYIIQDGKVRITREVIVDGEKDEVFGVGDFFGVISTMSSHRHIETAQAITDVALIIVHHKQYVPLIQKNSQVAMKIIAQFSKRLRYLNETLARLTLKKTAENDVSHLYKVAEYYFGHRQFDQAFYAFTQYLKYCPKGINAAAASENLAKIKNNPSFTTPMIYGTDESNRTYKRNTMLFAEGEPGDNLYIIKTGSIKITKIVDNSEVLLAMLKPGDILGEMALLEGKPRAASAVAYEDCTVIAVSKDNFELMAKSQPQLIAKITTLLAERLWLIYKQLANTFLDDPLCRIYDVLSIQLEKNRIPLDSEDSYTFGFGQWELANMVGLSDRDSLPIIKKLLEDENIRLIGDKVRAVSVKELIKQTEYHRKMDKIEKNKQQSRK